MAIDPRLLQAPGNVPPIHTSVSDLERRMRQLEAVRSIIGAGSITGGSNGMIATGAISANNIAAGTITATQIAAGSITSALIQAGAIQAGHIEAGAITSVAIAANTITAADIQAGTITSTEIAAGTITASDIAANTITAAQIAAGTITATQIASATITAAQIAAGTITADKLIVGVGGGNMLTNASFEFPVGLTNWGLYNNNLSPAPTLTVISSATPKHGTQVAQLTNGTDTAGQMGVTSVTNAGPAVEPGRTYTLSAWFWNSTAVSARVHINWLDAANAVIGGGTSTTITTTPSTWTRGIVTGTAPALATEAKVYGFYVDPASGQVSYIDAFMFQEGDVPTEFALREDEIAPGTITAIEIAASTITGSLIAAGTITATNIASSTITGSLIASATITGTNILANTITASHMNITGGLSAITADLGTITAGSITGATITGGTIRSSAANPRSEMTSAGFRLYNTAGDITFNADTATGKVIALGGLGGGNLLLQTAPTPADQAVLQRWTGSNPTVPVVETTVQFGDFNTWKHTSNGGGIAVIFSDWATDNVVLVEPGEEMVVSGYFRTSVAARYCRVRLIYYNAANVAIGAGTFTSPLVEIPVDTWFRNSVSGVAPATTVKARVLFDYTNSAAGAPASGDVWYLGGPQLERGRLATSYAPKVGEIPAEAVTTTELQDNLFSSEAVVDSHFAAGVLHADRMVANSITATQIAASTITSTQIAANTITAGDIQAGTITATQIATGTITATQIASATITATQMNVTTLSSITANLGTITAGTITGATIRTAASGSRVETTTAGLKAYNTTDETFVLESADGSVKIRTPVTGTTVGVTQPSNPSATTNTTGWGGTGLTRTTTAGEFDSSPGGFKIAVTGGGTSGGMLTSPSLGGTWTAGRRYLLVLKVKRVGTPTGLAYLHIQFGDVASDYGIVSLSSAQIPTSAFITVDVPWTPRTTISSADNIVIDAPAFGFTGTISWLIDSIQIIDATIPDVRQLVLSDSGNVKKGALYGYQLSGRNDANVTLEATPNATEGRLSSASLVIAPENAGERIALRLTDNPELPGAKRRTQTRILNDAGTDYISKVLVDSSGSTELQFESVRQYKGGGTGVNSANITTAPGDMIDSTGAGMQITVVPEHNCYWLVTAHSVWDTSTAAWNMIRPALELTTADADGRTIVSTDVQSHSDLQPWSGAPITALWKLTAGVSYTCKMRWVSITGGTWLYYRGDQYTHINGITLGAGNW